MLGGEVHVGKDVGFGLVEQGGKFWHARAHLVGDIAPLLVGARGVVLGKGGADPGGDHALLGFAGIGQRIAHEVDAVALPGDAEDFANRRLQPFMRIGDDQLDAAQGAPGQAAQEFHPERLGFAVAGGYAEHFAPAVGVHAHSDDDGGGDDAMIAPDLDV